VCVCVCVCFQYRGRTHLRDTPSSVVPLRSGGKPCTARLARRRPPPAHEIWVPNTALFAPERLLDILAPDPPVTTSSGLYDGLSWSRELARADILPVCAVEDPVVAVARHKGWTTNVHTVNRGATRLQQHRPPAGGSLTRCRWCTHCSAHTHRTPPQQLPAPTSSRPGLAS
jgi:hypothetical protein